ncbi:MAG: DNA mismatch repair endonuclease MutL [Brumimicrobium sp.]|nr:DNA mismatch repair endonuclease MutL [Brumimicrobium sp.]
MSEIIRLLPDNIANQIAAGEVIQRPASVVKELIENAVDADAKKIELHIKDAGKTLIQIIDDGKGMSDTDARMSFERHATSKLSSADDLFNLSTKGFRGEALASIAAIAHVEMETVESGAKIGTLLRIAGSKLDVQEPTARRSGTSISVKNLFFNVPARRNFLKSDQVETKHIIEEFNRIALTHPEIAFKFSHNGNVMHDLQSSGLRKRIVDLFGTNFNTKLVPIEEETDLVTIRGFIGKPEFARKTRGEQYFFVNNRFFRDNYLNHAVLAAYENLIQDKSYPAYFIYFIVPPSSIDVNIHPTKTEIKFEEDRNIYSILRSTVKLALGKYNIAPSLDFEREPQFDLPLSQQKQPVRPPEVKTDPNFNPFSGTKVSSSSGGSSSGSSGFKPLKPNKEDWENFYSIKETEVSTEEGLGFEKEPQATSESRKIQVHRKFVLVQVKSGLMIIHLNRAKERILYDQLMEQFMLSPISSQQMMFPFEYEMQPEQQLEWENNAVSLKRLGFDWQWDKKKLILSGIPSFLETEQVTGSIDAILEQITHADLDKGELAHELISALASASSRGPAPQMNDQELNHLIEELFQREEHQYTPKGKKILNTLTLNELNDFFV